MTMQAATVLDNMLKRDIAILSTLAHLHCATIHQIHALCFPYHTLATARTTLFYLGEARFVAHSTWRPRGGNYERGQVWTLTARGHDLLQRYAPHIPPLIPIDLGRPSTAVEHEEWRVRFRVRTLLVRLLVEARRTPLLHSIALELPWNVRWSTPSREIVQPEPDALVTVVWHPPERQPADWLPWLVPIPHATSTIHYPIYVERTQARTSLVDLLPTWMETWPAPSHIPVVIFQDEDHFEATSHQIATLPQLPTLRLATWTALEGGITQSQWRDERGLPSRLLPLQAGSVA